MLLIDYRSLFCLLCVLFFVGAITTTAANLAIAHLALHVSPWTDGCLTEFLLANRLKLAVLYCV